MTKENVESADIIDAEILKMHEHDARAHFSMGIAFLQVCEDCFSVDLYEQAIDYLVISYQIEQSEDVFALLYEIAYQPNEAFLRNTYDRHAAFLRKKGWEIDNFADLPFILFPIHERLYRIYDKKSNRFLAKNEINLQYEFTKKLMTKEQMDFDETIACLQDCEEKKRESTLFKEIEAALVKCEVEVALLDKINEYYALAPSSEWYDYFLGRYWFGRGDYKNAEFHAKKAVMKRRLSLPLNLFWAKCKEQNGDYITAIYVYLLMLKIYQATDVKLDFSADIIRCNAKAKAVSAEYYAILLDTASKAESNIRMAPWQYTVQTIDETGLEKQAEILYGRHVWQDDKQCSHFIGLYNEYGLYNVEARIMEVLQEKNLAYLAVTFDLLKASITRDVYLQGKKSPYIIPIASFYEDQEVLFTSDKVKGMAKLGRFEFNYFHIDNETRVMSKQDIVIGKPIVLTHDPKRKKLVLNLFVDALSFGEMERTRFRYTPNIIKFFQKGVIFANNYTPAEWTFPSSAAIQTGRYQGKTQLFHQKASLRLSDQIKTATEYFSDKGYYCVNISESNEMIYTQLHRGYDRVVIDSLPRACIGVERAIQHLKAYDTDHFLSLHFMDIHPFFADHHLGVGTQRNLTLADRLVPKYGSNVKSVYIDPSAIAVEEYHNSLQNLDRSLGYLFAYLEENYQEDEYIVNLYSDHGVSIFSEHHYFFDEGQGKTALMFRGAGVPSLGFVKDEMTNTIDWYRILLHFGECKLLDGDAEEIDAILPRCFGGTGREYTISNSLTPYQTYKLCIRTMDHEFRLETKGKTTYDGKVDMSEFTYEMYERNELHTKIKDQAKLEYFFTIAQKHTQGIRADDENDINLASIVK